MRETSLQENFIFFLYRTLIIIMIYFVIDRVSSLLGILEKFNSQSNVNQRPI
jgi:TM2 domain-containing membrane protein YozV